MRLTRLRFPALSLTLLGLCSCGLFGGSGGGSKRNDVYVDGTPSLKNGVYSGKVTNGTSDTVYKVQIHVEYQFVNNTWEDAGAAWVGTLNSGKSSSWSVSFNMNPTNVRVSRVTYSKTAY